MRGAKAGRCGAARNAGAGRAIIAGLDIDGLGIAIAGRGAAIGRAIGAGRAAAAGAPPFLRNCAFALVSKMTHASAPRAMSETSRTYGTNIAVTPAPPNATNAHAPNSFVRRRSTSIGIRERGMQVLVVGAGVVGLAIARAAAMAGHDVIVAEATMGIGNGVSSRNSEVIHGGMYYPTGSLRALHCPRGRRMLYAYCASHGVPHCKCGKLIVATESAEIATMEAIEKQGRANDIEGLELIDGATARALEPALACVAAVRSSETGIIDSHAFMNALRGDIEDRGGMIAFATPVERITRTARGWTVRFGGSEPGSLDVDAVVNSAGLGAQALGLRTDGYPAERVPRLVLARGNYFSYAGRPAFGRLIYPAPRLDGGLGTHVTLDLAGRMRFGPDVEWIDDENYDVDPKRALSFYDSIRRYWPGLKDDTLKPDYAGIRPKLTGPGEPAADFLIDGPAQHGLSGLVQLFGIESPGLTSSLSLAEAVAGYLDA